MPSEDLGIEVHPAWTGGWISRCGHVPSQIFLTNSRTWFTDHTGKTRWWRGVFEGDDSFCRLFPASVDGDTFPTEFLARWERYGHRMKLIICGSSGEFCGTQYLWNQRRLFQSLLIIHLLLQLQRVLKRPENANGLLYSITDGKLTAGLFLTLPFHQVRIRTLASCLGVPCRPWWLLCKADRMPGWQSLLQLVQSGRTEGYRSNRLPRINLFHFPKFLGHPSSLVF